MKTEIRILVIDDEAVIRQTLRTHLQSLDYLVEEAANGSEGLKLAADFHPHFIVLDLGLPDKNGLEVLKELRSWTKVPILILTANDDERTKVRLLEAGADDYLTKPFGPAELVARIRVGLRRHGMIEATPIFTSGDLVVDLNHRMVSRDGVEVKLTTTEYEVLSRLVRDHGKVVSQVQLLRQIWGSMADDQGHYLRVYINQLRKKLEVNPSQPEHILTESGVGYRVI